MLKYISFVTAGQEGNRKFYTYAFVIIVNNHLIEMKNKFEKSARESECPIRSVLDRFGDKWSILAILTLAETEKLPTTAEVCDNSANAVVRKINL